MAVTKLQVTVSTSTEKHKDHSIPITKNLGLQAYFNVLGSLGSKKIRARRGNMQTGILFFEVSYNFIEEALLIKLSRCQQETD